MTAADNLARWREAEQGATEGPWHWRNTQDVYLFGARTRVVMAFRRMGMNSAQPQFRDADGILQDGGRANLNAFPDAAFIAASREAMPALLAFAEAVLALATTDRTVCFCVTQERLLQVAEQHLTTASTPTTGERSVEPAAVTGSGRTANTGGLDSPGVGTSTTKEQS